MRDLGKRLAKGGDLGRAKRIDVADDRYIEFAKRTLLRDHEPRGPAHRGRLRQWRRLPGGAGSPVGARRRSHFDGRRARRLQHQPRLRLDLARGALPQGARAARRHRHRARRRRRPRDHRRRDGPHRRRRPAAGVDRGELPVRRPPDAARHRRDHHVELRARALSRRPQARRSRARRSATATCSITCASTATMSAASSPATSS